MREGKKLKMKRREADFGVVMSVGRAVWLSTSDYERRVPLSASPLTFSSSSFAIVIFRVYRHMCVRANDMDAQAQPCHSL